ncbi:hypothetical protein BJV82DRAFT_153838 [Fennellomyces sp. T-0311]|nr:hypothetical protein BJV82DRAFT_153838 [Fennellomyces sp. T-0311]
MTKRKADSDSLSIVKRMAFSWTDNADIPEATFAMEKLFDCWRQCFQEQQTASTANDLAAIVECSSDAIDFIHTTVLPKFLEFRANAYIKQKQRHKTNQDMGEIIKRSPRSLVGYMRLGDIRIEQGCFEEALTLCKNDLKAFPKYSSAYETLLSKINIMETSIEAAVNLYIAQCKLTEAARSAETRIRMYPTSPRAYFSAGNTYLI